MDPSLPTGNLRLADIKISAAEQHLNDKFQSERLQLEVFLETFVYPYIKNKNIFQRKCKTSTGSILHACGVK